MKSKIFNRESIIKLSLSAMFLAMGLLLPFLTGQIPRIGKMLLPMHIPALLCGFLCGPFYGAAVGAVMPLLRSLLFTMPPMFPTAAAMAVELACYGLISGAVYRLLRKKGILAIYGSLLAAMLGGRIAWGLTMVAFSGLFSLKSPFTWKAFLAGAFLDAIPGIILQLVLLPLLLAALERAGLLGDFSREKKLQTAESPL